ncbi:MAG: YcxB family protein [Lachnospiraceae bacterium]|nr:YcxB family protein [Lachnospiraceae bacterium]
MPIEFDVKPTQKDYYKFNMRHTYTSFNGIITIVVGIVVIILAFLMRERLTTPYFLLYLVLAVAFMVYYPFHYWVGAKRLAAISDLNGGIHFRVEDDGIHVSMKPGGTGTEQTEVMTWDMFYLALATKEYIYMYSSRVNAYIVPKSVLGDKLETFLGLLREKLPEHRRRL